MKIKLAEIDCNDNRKYDEESLKALSENIERIGLINPITLSKKENGRYEVIAGRRRFKAIQLLKWTELEQWNFTIFVPGKEKEIAFSENVMRQNLTILEEIEQLQELKDGGRTLQEIAAILGKSDRWVRVRMNLVNLRPDLLAEIGKQGSGWTLDALEEVAKLPKEVQKEINYPISVKSIRENENLTIPLSKAKFDLSPCEKCSHCSTADLLLWNSDQEPICLKTVCFFAKQQAFVKRRIDEVRKENPKSVLVDGDWDDSAPRNDKFGDTLNSWQYEKAKKGDAGAVQALVVSGKGCGKTMWIKPNSSASAKKATIKAEKTDADRMKEIEAKRIKWIGLKIHSGWCREGDPFLDFKEKLSDARMQSIIFRIAVFAGVHSIGGYNRLTQKFDPEDLKQYVNLTRFAEVVFNSFRDYMKDRIQTCILSQTLDEIKESDIRPLLEFVGLDWKALYAEAEVAVPLPKKGGAK